MAKQLDLIQTEILRAYVAKQREYIRKAEHQIGSVMQSLPWLERVVAKAQEFDPYYSAALTDFTNTSSDKPLLWFSFTVKTLRELAPLFDAFNLMDIPLEGWTSEKEENDDKCTVYTFSDHVCTIRIYAYLNVSDTCEKRLVGTRIITQAEYKQVEVPVYDYVCEEIVEGDITE